MTPRVRQFTLWPSGLIGRVILVLLAALVLEFAGSTLLYEQTAVLLPSNASLDELAQRLLRVERGLSYLPADCESAAGFGADQRDKTLKKLVLRGSRTRADTHL